MIHYTKDVDNVVTLRLDMDGREGNVINHNIQEAFSPIIKHLQAEKARHALKGIIITSDKPTWLEGGDLGYLYEATDAEELFRFAQRLKAFLRDLEWPGVPVVAAIAGDALGTGFEVALACHYRIALNQPRIRLGHPEVNIGLIPSGGAIIRLLWLLGVERALPILLNGRRYSPSEALKVGIIDDVADTPRHLLELAKEWCLNHQDVARPWDDPGAKIPGGTAYDPDMGRRIRLLTAELSAATHDHYPAKRAIIELLAEGSKVDFATACRQDSRTFAHLVTTVTCKNMISTFWFDKQAIKEGINRPKGFGRFRPRRIGIVGAGRMGSAIAFACLRRGMQVVLKDVSQPIADRGLQYVSGKLDEYIERGTFPEEERAELLQRIVATDKADKFGDCDLVIEAVFENAMVKNKVTRETEPFLDKYAILGSNTISIPITALAKAAQRPENYVGLHFFPPADQVPVIEIVKGELTSDETIARAFDFAIAINKNPIVVRDGWGFYAARVQNTYILEGITMLNEGYPPALIENMGRQVGMPYGPLWLADELGLELVLRYEEQADEHYGDKYTAHPAADVIRTMINELERPGSRQKAGFYDYSQTSGEPRLWDGLLEHYPVTKAQYNKIRMQERFLFAQVIEAAWCLEEGVIERPESANLASVYGWGFPAYTGGVMRYAAGYGKEAFKERCDFFRGRYGQRFRMPKYLR